MGTGRKKNANANRTMIVIVLLMVAVVGYYCYLVNRSDEATKEQELTAAQEVLLRDMERSYPPTPKEVVKYYNEIMKCFYNEECSQEEIEDLAVRARELYDEELLEHNEWGPYIISLTAEIMHYRENNMRLVNCSVAASTDVDMFEDDGYSFARLSCGYTVLQGKENTSTMQIYLLRKDEDGHWKIYGWDLAENVNVGEKESKEE